MILQSDLFISGSYQRHWIKHDIIMTIIITKKQKNNKTRWVQFEQKKASQRDQYVKQTKPEYIFIYKRVNNRKHNFCPLILTKRNKKKKSPPSFDALCPGIQMGSNSGSPALIKSTIWLLNRLSCSLVEIRTT